MSDEDFPKKIDKARKTGSFHLGERKLLDDLYEASQEGAPLRETIESLQEEIPLCETPADLRELFRTELDVLFTLVEKAFPRAESVPVVEEIEAAEQGGFIVRFGVRGSPRPVPVLVDAVGRFLRLL